MQFRILPAVGVSAAALVAATALASGASASHGVVSPSHRTPVGQLVHQKRVHPDNTTVCYSQRANDNGVGIISQDFTDPGFDVYDSRGADDFRVRAGGCDIRAVHAFGTYFNGSGPADGFNVTFYADNAGMPGAVVADLPNVTTYTDKPSSGNPVIHLKDQHVALSPGRYWVSVQAVMEYGVGGEWGWNTNITQRGNPAMWENPGDGFVTGCTTYTPMTVCIVAGEGPDFAFSLSGPPRT